MSKVGTSVGRIIDVELVPSDSPDGGSAGSVEPGYASEEIVVTTPESQAELKRARLVGSASAPTTSSATTPLPVAKGAYSSGKLSEDSVKYFVRELSNLPREAQYLFIAINALPTELVDAIAQLAEKRLVGPWVSGASLSTHPNLSPKLALQFGRPFNVPMNPDFTNLATLVESVIVGAKFIWDEASSRRAELLVGTMSEPVLAAFLRQRTFCPSDDLVSAFAVLLKSEQPASLSRSDLEYSLLNQNYSPNQFKLLTDAVISIPNPDWRKGAAFRLQRNPALPPEDRLRLNSVVPTSKDVNEALSLAARVTGRGFAFSSPEGLSPISVRTGVATPAKVGSTRAEQVRELFQAFVMLDGDAQTRVLANDSLPEDLVSKIALVLAGTLPQPALLKLASHPNLVGAALDAVKVYAPAKVLQPLPKGWQDGAKLNPSVEYRFDSSSSSAASWTLDAMRQRTFVPTDDLVDVFASTKASFLAKREVLGNQNLSLAQFKRIATFLLSKYAASDISAEDRADCAAILCRNPALPADLKNRIVDKIPNALALRAEGASEAEAFCAKVSNLLPTAAAAIRRSDDGASSTQSPQTQPAAIPAAQWQGLIARFGSFDAVTRRDICANNSLPAAFVDQLALSLLAKTDVIPETLGTHPALSESTRQEIRGAGFSTLQDYDFSDTRPPNLTRVQYRWDAQTSVKISKIVLGSYPTLLPRLLEQRTFIPSDSVVRAFLNGSPEPAIFPQAFANPNFSEKQFRALTSFALTKCQQQLAPAVIASLLANPALPSAQRTALVARLPQYGLAGLDAAAFLNEVVDTLKLASVAAAATATNSPGSNGASVASDVAVGRDVARGNPGVARLKQGAVGVLYELVLADPALSQRARRLLNGKPELLSVDGLSDAAVREIGRPGWLALFANPATRSIAIKAINDEASRISNTIKTTMDELKKGEQFYAPVIVIGSGPQAASFVNELARTDPSKQVLVVDGSSRLAGGNFAELGKMFSLNSREGVDEGNRPLPGTDETLNKVISQVTPSDLGGQRWNPADSVAIASAVGVYASGANTLLDETVLSVVDGEQGGVGKAQSWAGRYRVVFESGREAYTDHVVFGAGLGEEKLPFKDEASLALATAERAKVNVGRPNEVPQVLTTSDAFRLAQAAVSPRDPYRGKENVTLVVGAGDSARTFIELMQGLGPQSAYTGEAKDDTAQRGGVGPMVWLTGKSGFDSCEEYLAESRPRYAQLSVALKSPDEQSKPRVEPKRGQLASVTKLEDGRIKVIYSTFTKDGAPSGTSELTVDRVVLATGYQDGLGKVLGSIVGQDGDYKSKLENVTASREQLDFGSELVAVARQMPKQNLLFIGAAAGQLPTNEELRGVLENKAALFANTPRTQVAARLFAATAKTRAQQLQVAGKSGAAEFSPVSAPGRTARAVTEEEESPTIDVGFDKALASFDNPELYVKYGIFKALQQTKFAEVSEVSVTIGKSKGLLTFASPGVDVAVTIRNAFAQDPVLRTAARVMVEGSKKKYTFTFAVNSNGEATAKA